MKKRFLPPEDFAAKAHISSPAVLDRFTDTADLQSDAFWTELSKALQWTTPFHTVLNWQMPRARWFEGGELNVAVNCVDRHLKQNAKKTALLWEGEPGETRRVSYQDLSDMHSQIANALRNAGIEKGDRVAIYMPMVPEIVASMLACARIGAVHTVVFGGFSPHALYDRINDSKAKVLITADGTYRKGQFLDLKKLADEALAKGPNSVTKVLVYQRDPKRECPLTKGRDVLWKDSVLKEEKTAAPEIVASEDPLFILYASGTTGKPKGLFHTQAGYLLWSHWTSRWLFDLKNEDLFWCTADCGWVTGHTYVTYGPLSNGASVFLYEGAPTHPAPDRFWDMIDRHKISILYTAPTAIRTFMRLGDEWPRKRELKSLRLLGSVGEPINPEAWEWYYKVIGHERCPVVDTYWQTETGATILAPFPGASTLKPGSASKPLPGIDAVVVNPESGRACGVDERGVLVIRKPWPAQARGIWGDPERFEKTYWNTRPELKGVYVTSDFAIRDLEGDIWIEGRMDDVLNVSGHRIGSAEVESALVSHDEVTEAAAVGIPDPVKGQGIAVFITLKESVAKAVERGERKIDQIKEAARQQVARELGAFARPDHVRVARALPKTRSGKIMRRLLRELASTGKITGDTTTLEDFEADKALSEG